MKEPRQDADVPLVLIVDDNTRFRATARLLLETDGYEVAEADSGAAGIRDAQSLAPDLVLLDVRLPDIDGFDVADRLSRLTPPPAVIMISSRDATDYGSLVASASVRGFIPKSDLSAGAIRALVPG